MMSADDGFSDDFEPDDMPDEAAEVECPYCGEIVELILDPGGGMSQDYIEDCEICCRPWHVQVTYGEDGGASVEVEAVDD